jgi:hypothetical protein
VLIDPHSFSQNSAGPFLLPLKQPQNIHPRFLGTLFTTQVSSHCSPGNRVTRFLRCRPPHTQLSSLQTIVFHCLTVQLMWASAKAILLARFCGVRGGFWRAMHLLYPLERRVERTTYSPICQSSKWRASSKYVICLVSWDDLTKSMSSYTCSGVSTPGLPGLFFGVRGASKRTAPASQ